MAPVELCRTVLSGMERPHREGSQRQGLVSERPCCAACADVIGVYEPLVHVFGGLAWRTSRAAEPSVAAADGLLYHLKCYERLGEAGAGSMRGTSSFPP